MTPNMILGSQGGNLNSVKKFKDNGYLITPKILSGELLDFIGVYAYNAVRVCETNGINVFTDSMFPTTPCLAADAVMENLSGFLLPKIESVTGLKLLSTYTFYRVYKAGDILFKHTDREACEISISLCLRKKGNIWPICVNNTDYKMRERNNIEYIAPLQNPNIVDATNAKEILENMYKEHIGDTTSIMLDEGDAVIYRGCELPHWREAYNEGTKLAQVFLHYVDANGKFTEWKDDKVHNKYFAQDK
jgi:hypothetical protein